jgi:hypothetical protein
MSKKHYVFAANKIVNECYELGIKKEDCPSYHCFLEFFNEFGDKFDSDKFDEFIDKKIKEL